MLMYACTANLSRRPFVWALGRHFKKTKELLLVCSVCVYSPLKRKHGITQLQKLKITHFKNLSSSKIIRTLHSFQGLAVSAANRLVLIICTALSTAHLLFVVGWQINLSNTVCSPVGAFRSKVWPKQSAPKLSARLWAQPLVLRAIYLKKHKEMRWKKWQHSAFRITHNSGGTWHCTEIWYVTGSFRFSFPRMSESMFQNSAPAPVTLLRRMPGCAGMCPFHNHHLKNGFWKKIDSIPPCLHMKFERFFFKSHSWESQPSTTFSTPLDRTHFTIQAFQHDNTQPQHSSTPSLHHSNCNTSASQQGNTSQCLFLRIWFNIPKALK